MCPFACARSSVEITFPYNTCGPAGTSGSPCPLGTAWAARSTTAWRRDTVCGSAESATRKTTVNAPSLRSPKCCSSTVRTRSESVPGTLNTFDWRSDSRPDAQNPTTRITSQAIATGQRCRSTHLVHVPDQVSGC